MITELPLFPLNTVLFPGATITLHIFEDRYREMIGRCLEQNSPFGVVLIRSGDSVLEGVLGASQPEPYAIGTIARISASVRVEDGRYLLSAVGERRFRIEQIVQYTPYLVASILELPEEITTGLDRAVSELRATYNHYWQQVAVATGVPVTPDELADEPTQMIYQLADRLQLSLQRKQHWLESDFLTCMHEMTNALRAELALLPNRGLPPPEEGWSGLGSLN